MRVMSAEGLQTELPMHEYDCIAGFEEVLCGRRSSRSCVGLGLELDISKGFWSSPALKLSRKRTLDDNKPPFSQQLFGFSHIQLQGYGCPSALPSLRSANGLWTMSYTHRYQDHISPCFQLPLHKRPDLFDILLERWRGRLGCKIFLCRECRRLCVHLEGKCGV